MTSHIPPTQADRDPNRRIFHCYVTDGLFRAIARNFHIHGETVGDVLKRFEKAHKRYSGVFSIAIERGLHSTSSYCHPAIPTV
jgi:hypothetical protein